MSLAKFQTKSEVFYTVSEYLEMERDALERSEYIDGEIYLMAGESDEHGDISVNLVMLLGQQLKGTNCRARTMNTKVKSGGFGVRAGSSTKGMFSYPDLVVICGEVLHYVKKKDIVLNPKVIIEVLSRSTEKFDRNDKFVRYKMFNETLTDYILVSQDKPMVEHFIRQNDNSWKVFTFIGLNDVCKIESINCQLELSDVYDRISFSKQTTKFLKEIANRK